MSREPTVIAPKADAEIEQKGSSYELMLHDANTKVVFGDENSGSFKPCARYSAFGNDGTGLVFQTPTSKTIAPVLQDGVIGWDDAANNLGVRFYQHLDGKRWDSAVEHEVILYAAPPSADIPFSIELAGLDLFLQGELDAWEVERGNSRPIELIGGFVAYHSSKTRAHGIQGDAAKYKCGKAFELPRPTAEDATGARIWGAWKYQPELSLMTAVFDTDWLASARYPVIIGPTIGYTSLGASTDATGKFALANQFVCSGSGDANPGTAFIGGASTGGATVYAGIYENGDGNISANARLAVSSAITIPAGAAGFRSAAITWTGIVNATTYFLEVYSNVTDFVTRYDNTGATNQYTSTGATGTPPDPHATRGGTQVITPSIYIDYTASGGGGFIPFPRPRGLSGGMHRNSGGLV